MKLVVAVCGSVAAVRAPEIVRELRRRDYQVVCAMSTAAFDIINPNVLEWASDEKVICEITGAVEHVKLLGIGGEADLLLICPATSNTISKIANGIDDSVVTTLAATAIGSGKKVVIVPAMHQSMYENPFVVENIEKLKAFGIELIDPQISENKAKIADNEAIVEFVENILKGN